MINTSDAIIISYFQAKIKEASGNKKEQKKAKREKKRKALEKKIKLHYVQGKKHFSNKDYIAAKKEFKDILILDPNNKHAKRMLIKMPS